MPDAPRANSIAIIGMAARMPGANSIERFWSNIAGGVESITRFSDEELLAAGAEPAWLERPDFVKAAPVLEAIDKFDAAFFKIARREAEMMDPQQRIMLELAWEALERAGYAGPTYRGLIGVVAGAGGLMSSYLLSPLHVRRQLIAATGSMQCIGNDKDYLATRISYKLNLRGPSLTVQTACSTSLVAVHLACQSLLAGDCDLCLAGGVTVRVPHRMGYLSSSQALLSPDGHCRAFDAGAEGTVFGSGAGFVLLKPLPAAVRDGDPIVAVIRGSAVNNDGAAKLSYWAASADGQTAACADAMAVAEVEPRSIGYLEAHGTATAMGDPVEIFGLSKAYRRGTDDNQFCAIGSVKTNIGHLEAAAGVAGLIKAALSLQHQTLPPSLHFSRPNPAIHFADTPFFVNTQCRPWAAGGLPRRAAVNSLGIGGTNAHVILEEAPEATRACSAGVPPAAEDVAGVPPASVGCRRDACATILPLSAKTPQALRELAGRYVEYFAVATKPRSSIAPDIKPRSAIAPETDPRSAIAPETDPRSVIAPETDPRSVIAPETDPRSSIAPETKPRSVIAPETDAQSAAAPDGAIADRGFLADVAFTAQIGREHFAHRLAVVAGSAEEARGSLDQWLRQGHAPACAAGTVDTVDPPVVFLFPDQDSAYDGMGRELWETAPVFREAIRRCEAIIKELELGGGACGSEECRTVSDEWPGPHPSSLILHPSAIPSHAQPALFAVQYALAELWKSWGIVPAAVVGHGGGQYAAACAAGVFSLEDGLKLVAARSRLIEMLPADGRMLAVMAGADRVADVLSGLEVEDAGRRRALPALSIAAVNSPRQTVVSGSANAIGRLASELAERRIRARLLPVAHAAHSPAMQAIAGEFGRVCETVAFRQPRVPVVSGVSGKLAGPEIARPDYWRRELCQPVRFADGIAALDEQGYRIFLEIGPQPKLLGLGRRCMRHWAGLWLPSLKRGRPAWQVLLRSLAKLYAQGVKIEWTGLHRGAARRRVLLPTYPFQRQRYWLADDRIERREAKGEGGTSATTGHLLSAFPLLPLDSGDLERLVEELKAQETFSDEEARLLPRVLRALAKRQTRKSART